MKHQPDYCKPADVGLEIGPDTNPKYVEAIERHFALYAKPIVKLDNGKRSHLCFNCGGEFNSFMQAFGAGNYVGFEWGVTHGEARCSGCHWPATGHHFIKADGEDEDLCTLRNVFLLYHPDNVMAKKRA